MIKGSSQDRAFRAFCKKNHYQPHKNLALFCTDADSRWILYRRGTKHPQWMKEEKELFPGWTFSKSTGNEKEREMYRCVCLHCPAYEGVREDEKWFFRRSVFEGAINKVKAKRIYIAKSRTRQVFDERMRKLLTQRQTDPIYD